MRIRGSHIAGLVLALLAGFVIFAVYTTSRPPGWDDREDSLEQMRRTKSGDAPGLLPPVGTDPDLIPRIEMEQEVHLGLVPNHESSVHTVKIHNRGRRDLRITNIQTTCPCTQGRLDQDTAIIPPGGEADMAVLFTPSLAPGFESTQSLTISSNDPARPQFMVQVKADIEPEFELTPDVADFGTVAKGSAPEVTIRLRQLREEPFEVHSVHPFADEGLVELEGSVTPVPQSEWQTSDKAEWDVHIRLLPLVPTGEYNRLVSIHTDIERMPGYPLPVQADVVVPYTVDPAFPRRLVVRRTVGEEEATLATATITAPSRLHVSGVQPTESLFHVEVLPEEDGRTVVLEVSLREDAPPGRHQEEFTYTLITDGEAYPERMAVIGYVDEPGAPAQEPEEDTEAELEDLAEGEPVDDASQDDGHGHAHDNGHGHAHD